MIRIVSLVTVTLSEFLCRTRSRAHGSTRSLGWPCLLRGLYFASVLSQGKVLYPALSSRYRLSLYAMVAGVWASVPPHCSAPAMLQRCAIHTIAIPPVHHSDIVVLESGLVNVEAPFSIIMALAVQRLFAPSIADWMIPVCALIDVVK